MIELKEETLLSFLHKVKEQAIRFNSKQLFSWTKRMDAVDFINVFEALGQTEENRMYWSNSAGDFQLLGIGDVQTITRYDNQFKQSQKKWELLLEKAIIHNPYQEKGTGITAIGGMAFDSMRKQSKLWEKYPPGQLVIPTLLLTYTNDNYYMTFNHFFDQHESAEDILEQMNVYEQLIFTAPEFTKTTKQTILDQQVIKPYEWKALVEKAVQQIKQNKAKKIVLAREVRITLNQAANISHMLRKLLIEQPNSYVFAIEKGEDCFIGATPERLVLLEEKRLLSTCLAGTAPRGETEELDQTIANHLLSDEKNREEHEYVVQMIKENIAGYCEDIQIPEEPVIYPLRNLQHLYTPVTAKLRENYTVFDIVHQLHPTPALGGVPRKKALQFIRNEEFMDRGWYGAPVGWLDSNDNSEFAVAIRSGLIQKDEVSLFAGCGVMRDSDPEMEFEETNVKLLPMLHVLEDHDESY